MNEMLDVVVSHIMPAAFGLLPSKMNTIEAQAQILTIGMQETKYEARRQVTKDGYGPARSFWQFERISVKEVIINPMTRAYMAGLADVLRYPSTMVAGVPADREFQMFMEHNDVLACGAARLLLWPHAAALPRRNEPAKGWNQYIARWHPGQPHRETWDDYFELAWQILLTRRDQTQAHERHV